MIKVIKLSEVTSALVRRKPAIYSGGHLKFTSNTPTICQTYEDDQQQLKSDHCAKFLLDRFGCLPDIVLVQ